MTERCPKHKVFVGKAGCKRCAAEKEEKKQTIETAHHEGELMKAAMRSEFENGIRFVTGSRLFRMAFWPFAKVHHDRMIKKARKMWEDLDES